MSSDVLDKIGSNPGLRALFTIARHRDWAKNRVVIRDGEAPGHLYLLLSGSVCVRHPGRYGRELLLAYFYPGDFFGEMCLFPGVASRSAMVKTASACSMLEIPYREFIALSREYPELWLELAGQLAERLRKTNHRLAETPVLHAADRVWLVIEEMARHQKPLASGGRLVQITRKDLGRLAGCSREVAGLVLADLAKAGRIELPGRAILVPAAAESAPRSRVPSSRRYTAGNLPTVN